MLFLGHSQSNCKLWVRYTVIVLTNFIQYLLDKCYLLVVVNTRLIEHFPTFSNVGHWTSARNPLQMYIAVTSLAAGVWALSDCTFWFSFMWAAGAGVVLHIPWTFSQAWGNSQNNRHHFSEYFRTAGPKLRQNEDRLIVSEASLEL